MEKSTFAMICMRSVQAGNFLSLYDILTTIVNSHFIPANVILKQAAITVFHSHLYLFFGINILPHSL